MKTCLFMAGRLLLLLVALLPAFTSASAFHDSDPGDRLHGEPLVIAQYAGRRSSDWGDDEESQLWCDSWRVAGEANNLAPWKAVPGECAGYVKRYVSGKAYLSDLEMVAREASRYARSVAMAGDGREAWVFDIDETLLSNLPYYAEHQYGVEFFDHLQFDKWVEDAAAPPIMSSLKLYEEIRNLGFRVFLLTGRSEAHRNVTVENLLKAGYRDWERLILRNATDRGKTAVRYKSEKRNALLNDGYRLFGNSGDQWSDLLGSSTGNRSFKLPNPMYYIP